MKNFALHIWRTIGACDRNGYSQRICNGFTKLYCFIFKSNVDSGGTYDLLLLYAFVIIFLAFLVASAVTIFEEDQKSLQLLKRKVMLSTNAIASLAATVWTIKQTRLNSITYEGYVRINRSKSTILKMQENHQPKETPPLESVLSDEISMAKSKPKYYNRPLSGSSSSSLKKIGITRLPQQQKLYSIFNIQCKKSRVFQSSGSSSSLHPKFGLPSEKSQHSILSIDSRKTKFEKKKSVQIDERWK